MPNEISEATILPALGSVRRALGLAWAMNAMALAGAEADAGYVHVPDERRAVLDLRARLC
jgi:hypothetical protein